jgi:hypothetical protein
VWHEREINRSVDVPIDRPGARVDDRTAAVVAALERGIIRLPGTNPLNRSIRI